MAFRLERNHYLLAALFFIVFTSRLYFSLQTPYLSNNEDYFVSRQVESIRSTGLPLVNDDLSYGGRTNIGSPVFYYIISFFSLFMPVEIVAKVIMNLFASSLIFVVYLIANELTKNSNAALFSAFISGFMPVFFRTTLNSLSIHSLLFPLLFFSIYCFLKIDDERYVYVYLASIFLLAFLSPISLLLIVGFVFYIALIKLDRMKQSRKELEVIFFSIFFMVWFLFVLYKKAFMFHGYSVIWQNIPGEILKNYFGRITVLGAIYQLGSIPVLYAIYAMLQHIYRPKYRTACLFSGFAFSAVLLLWLRLIEIDVGLIYLGIISVLLFAQFYKWSFQYWKNTHFAKFNYVLGITFILSFILTSVIPSTSYAQSTIKNTMSDEEMSVFRGIEENTPKDAVVLAPLNDGHLVTGIAKRKNVADNNFLLVRDAEERYEDIEKIYTAAFETEALQLITKYSISYILVTPDAVKNFGINDLKYSGDENCFNRAYNKTMIVYEVKCELKSVGKGS